MVKWGTEEIPRLPMGQKPGGNTGDYPTSETDVIPSQFGHDQNLVHYFLGKFKESSTK